MINKTGKLSKTLLIQRGYDEALKFAASHYENFPVVSFLIPKHLRKHIAIVYWFARTADDIADDGVLTIAEKYFRLTDFQKSFEKALSGTEESRENSRNKFWLALVNTITEFKLSRENFFKLLKAFNSDIEMKGFDTFEDVLAYCSFSANPVGRIILELFNIRDEKAVEYSDKICTALQLTNFYQDISRDILTGRIYIDRDELNKYSVTEEQISNGTADNNFKMLMQLQVERTKKMFAEGRNLLGFLRGGLRKEIAWTILGGEEILKKIESINYDTLNRRPAINKFDLVRLIIKSFNM